MRAFPVDHEEAQSFARQWAEDWNAHNIDALLEHFIDDVVFTSPVAVRILGGDDDLSRLDRHPASSRVAPMADPGRPGLPTRPQAIPGLTATIAVS